MPLFAVVNSPFSLFKLIPVTAQENPIPAKFIVAPPPLLLPRIKIRRDQEGEADVFR